MAYRRVAYSRSGLVSVDKVEGETIEQKMERVLENNEPITDGAPEIFTERKQGVMSAYNIRTDRWEIACEAMDKVHGSRQAARENKADAKMDVVKDGEKGLEGTDGEAVPEGA